MHSLTSAMALLAAALVAGLSLPAAAGPLDVMGPEIVKGEAEVSTNHSFHTGFQANADRLQHSYELAVAYSPSEYFKAGAKLGFDRWTDIGGQLSVVGVDGQVFLGRPAPAIALAWYTGLDMRASSGETNTLTFGPLIQFGDDALSLTLNPHFEHTFGPNSQDGLAFAYAVGLKAAWREGVALGIEAHGWIADIGSALGTEFQEHRAGPVVYIEHMLSPALGDRNARKLAIELGAFVGFTEATPDWTGKIKASLFW